MHQTCTSTKTKTKILATTQIYDFAFVFCGACAGLVHLCRFCDSDLARHLQAPTKTKQETKLNFHQTYYYPYFYLVTASVWGMAICNCRLAAGKESANKALQNKISDDKPKVCPTSEKLYFI